MRLMLKDVLENKYTYPSWSSGSKYKIHYEELSNKEILVFYRVASNKRKISRIFPAYVYLTPAFCWCLGFLKGEGSNSLGSSNYRRLTITNSNPALIRLCINQLFLSRLLDKNLLPDGCFHIMHASNPERNIKFWSSNLGFPTKKFKVFYNKNKKSKNGVCHIYLSDVLLRKVLNEINAFVIKF